MFPSLTATGGLVFAMLRKEKTKSEKWTEWYNMYIMNGNHLCRHSSAMMITQHSPAVSAVLASFCLPKAVVTKAPDICPRSVCMYACMDVCVRLSYRE